MQSADESPKKDNSESETDSEATSKDLLADIEENEAEIDSGGSAPDPGPSPDGAEDEG
jgi:hypothetical protein